MCMLDNTLELNIFIDHEGLITMDANVSSSKLSDLFGL